MAASSIPLVAIIVCFAAGILVIASGIPLYFRLVPPNLFYGARFNSTLADDSVWYDINARAGRDAIVIGAFYLALFTIALVFGDAWSLALRVMGPIVILMAALIIDAIVLGVAAARLAKRRA